MDKISKQLTNFAKSCLEDLKAENITEIDVSKVSPVTDSMLIATGTSKQHVKAIANYIKQQTKEKNIDLVGFVGENNGEWVLIDLGDVVTHVMLPEVREYYELEKLWNVD